MWEILALVVVFWLGYGLANVQGTEIERNITADCDRLGVAWIAGKAYQCNPKDGPAPPAPLTKPRT